MTEEAMLFRRVQEGCWEAFDVLFHTYAEQLFFYAMGFVNNREEARDILCRERLLLCGNSGGRFSVRGLFILICYVW